MQFALPSSFFIATNMVLVVWVVNAGSSCSPSTSREFGNLEECKEIEDVADKTLLSVKTVRDNSATKEKILPLVAKHAKEWFNEKAKPWWDEQKAKVNSLLCHIFADKAELADAEAGGATDDEVKQAKQDLAEAEKEFAKEEDACVQESGHTCEEEGTPASGANVCEQSSLDGVYQHYSENGAWVIKTEYLDSYLDHDDSWSKFSVETEKDCAKKLLSPAGAGASIYVFHPDGAKAGDNNCFVGNIREKEVPHPTKWVPMPSEQCIGSKIEFNIS